jgi:hypothetical protein
MSLLKIDAVAIVVAVGLATLPSKLSEARKSPSFCRQARVRDLRLDVKAYEVFQMADQLQDAVCRTPDCWNNEHTEGLAAVSTHQRQACDRRAHGELEVLQPIQIQKGCCQVIQQVCVGCCRVSGEGPELEVINVESPDKPANMGAGELQLEQGLYEHLELTDTPNLYALVEQRARNCLHSS